MPSSEALHFAAQFKVAADFGVVEKAEAIDDGKGAACHFDDFIGVKVPVHLMLDARTTASAPLRATFMSGSILRSVRLS